MRTLIVALVLGMLLSACGAGAPSGASGGSLAGSGPEEKVLNVYNWSDYIEPSVLNGFTKETGIRVNYDVFDANEVLETKLLTGHTNYDVVVPSAPFLERQIKAGVFRVLDKSLLPNLKNLDPQMMKSIALYDP